MSFSSRTKKILQLVKDQKIEKVSSPSKRTYQDVINNEEIENIDSEIDSYQVPKKINILSTSALLEISNLQPIEPVLSPEEMEDVINNATVVFDDSFGCLGNIEEITGEAMTLNLLANESSSQNNHTSLQNVMETTINNDTQNSQSGHENTLRETTEKEREDSDGSYAPEIDNEETDRSSGLESEPDTSNVSDQEIRKPTNKKRQKGENKKKKNKLLRMCGSKYLGFRKPAGQRNTFHDKNRSERNMKRRCKCKKKNTKSTNQCFLISDEDRAKIFKMFWETMSWDQRKVFVSNTVVVTKKATPQKLDHDSRRKLTFKYTLKVNNENVPVCKSMYLGTLALGEWSVRSWAMENQNGMNESIDHKVSNREPRLNIFKEDGEFLGNFLKNLNKLPSHYCRKDTDRLYLEQVFQSVSDLYRAYCKFCAENGKTPLSHTCLRTMMDTMKLSIFHPRKDQCDTCFKFKNGNLSEEEYKDHIIRKDRARSEKERDKNEAIEGKVFVITMDVQLVKLSPQLPASAPYYKTKLCCHNFTVYNLANGQASCYWYKETEADGQASTYASFLEHYLEENFLNSSRKLSIIIYSDGCTAQNRNSVMSNTLLYLSEKYDVLIEQKFLEKGHTQMECDSVHSSIETALKNKEIYLPSDYLKVTNEARSKNHYTVKNFDHTFFKNFGDKNLIKYSSIRPSKLVGGKTVTDIRVLRYISGKIFFKINFDDSFEEIPTRPKNVNFSIARFPPLFESRLAISKTKYDHLQVIKSVIPRDCWPFYDLLPYK